MPAIWRGFFLSNIPDRKIPNPWLLTWPGIRESNGPNRNTSIGQTPFPTIRCNSFSIHGSLRKRIYEQWRLSERHELDTANHVHGRDAAPGQVSFFAPIILSNELCLKCHGEPGKDIAPEHAALIDELYTEDQAKGFRLGQLRGAWRVDIPMAAFDQPAR